MANKPNIRFKGFTEDWEQRKLGEICSRVQGNDGRMELPTLTISAANGWMKQEDRFSGNIAGKEQKNYTLLHKGELSYNHGNSKLAKYGTVFSLQTYEEALVPRVYHSFKVEIGSADFIEYYFATKMPDRELRKLISSGARMDGLLNIGYDDFMGIKMMFPSVLEQDKIAEYFRAFDHLITLHQRKCDDTKKLKKYMLQKMFPKNGEKKPEIRFAGFTDDWEQRKLEDYIIEYHEVTTENNQYPALTSSRKGIFLQTEYFAGNQIASDDNTGYNIVPYGYFTYRHMSDDEIFHFNINDIVENGIVSTLYPVFTTNDKLDSRYLQYQLNYGYEFARFAVLQKQGGSRTYMYLSKLKQLSLTMPKDVEEQKKISGFLMELDNLITLHQRKCDDLKNLKKYMLQNMFV